MYFIIQLEDKRYIANIHNYCFYIRVNIYAYLITYNQKCTVEKNIILNSNILFPLERYEIKNVQRDLFRKKYMNHNI